MSGNYLNDYTNKSQCCGCGACSAICPQIAITMKPDKLGFCFPVVNNEVCIHCGLCEKVCHFSTHNSTSKPISSYVAISRDYDILMASSSGGVFTEIARKIIDDGGSVFGAALKRSDGVLSLEHESISSMDALCRITGSKYFQSSVSRAYVLIKKKLLSGEKVLFCGTPCQVDGLYGFLQKEYPNLYTLDLVCHGVPSPKLFNEYIQWLEKSYGASRVDLVFRDKKKNGWGHGAVANITKTSGKVVQKKIPYKLSAFYATFMGSQLIRESCYTCKYSNEHRLGDITLGDYWGIHREHPDLLKSHGGIIDVEKGVSCILINSDKGQLLFDLCKESLITYSSTFEKISRNNPALLTPPNMPSDRDNYLNAYTESGYSGIEKVYKNQHGREFFWMSIKNLIPNHIKRRLLRRG